MDRFDCKSSIISYQKTNQTDLEFLLTVFIFYRTTMRKNIF